MTSIIGKELRKWKDSLKLEDLDAYSITVLNIILNNYDELNEAGGTAWGKRVTKFAELVSSKDGICDTGLCDILISSSSDKNKIKRISSLEVESFRGFATSRRFELDKQYVLLYGPNGSGKTSFSEALEYGLLGSIEEAEADHIKLAAYIKNTSTNRGIAPAIRCMFEDGVERDAVEDYDTYRFAFIEKNRIMSFSHIGSLTAKNQSERMAALFGLSEFFYFVQGFTRNFDARYLPISSATEKSFKDEQAVRNVKYDELSELEKGLEEVKSRVNNAVANLAKDNKEIETIQQAIDYYDNPKNGILTIKIQNKSKETFALIEKENYITLKGLCDEIKSHLDIVIKKRNELANKAMEVNYKTLYETISQLEETGECPACGTPLINVSRNPYSYAKEKMKEYREIDDIKKDIHDEAEACKTAIDEVTIFFRNNKELVELLKLFDTNLISVSSSDIGKYDEAVKEWHEFGKNICKFTDEEVYTQIENYNSIAQNKNNIYIQEIEKLKEKEKELVKLSTQLTEREKLVNENKAFIEEFDKKSEGILLKISEEKKQAEFNINIMNAYQNIIEKLYDYAEKLPKLIANDLEDKIVDYYNVINRGDAEFEMLSDICLPDDNSKKLVITFKDGSVSNALQVLSEGHIKILGLSILLAKATKDNLNFIIFDDIVNAIDDEHRNGVANLIMLHEDFKDKQIILSTHGEQFVLKLKDRLGVSRSNKDAVIYKFLPADSLKERGVIVEYSDAKTPIDAAKKKYDDNELKDASSKCRQAMESISYNIWNKISGTSLGEISVALRSPKSQPDLASVVDALKKKTKKITGMESITEKLEEIRTQDNWRVLNKGTHFEDEQPEFERADVKNVIDILIELDDKVRELKISEIAVI